MVITIEFIASEIGKIREEISDVRAKIAEIYNAQPTQQTIQQAAQAKAQLDQMSDIKMQQKLQTLQQERQMITQLQMEGYTKKEAIDYYNRMLKGEKPWFDESNDS